MCPDYLDAESCHQHGCAPSLSTNAHPSLKPGVQVWPWRREGVDPGSCQGRGSGLWPPRGQPVKERILRDSKGSHPWVCLQTLTTPRQGAQNRRPVSEHCPWGLQGQSFGVAPSPPRHSPPFSPSPQSKHSPDSHPTMSTRASGPFKKRALTSPLTPSLHRQKPSHAFSSYGLSTCSVPGMLLGTWDTSSAKTKVPSLVRSSILTAKPTVQSKLK